MLSYDSPKPIEAPGSPPTLSLSTAASPSTMALPSASLNGAVAANAAADNKDFQHIWLVTGPAGCGKTTVAEFLSNSLDMPYVEGDSFHPAANIEKMRNGIPLTDADRWDWLTALREEAIRQLGTGASGVVLTCSALKRKYRDVIRVAGYFDHRLAIHFIFLDASEEVLLQRVQKRQNHYMGANMVHSQFDILERPSRDEKDTITIDVSVAMDEVKRNTLSNVLESMAQTGASR